MSGKLIVVNRDSYSALITSDRILKDEIILKLQGLPSQVPTKYTVQVSADIHLLPFSDDPAVPSSFFRFLNHSCKPSACFNMSERTLIALRNIDPGEEVNFNYNTTEYEMACPFSCRCGSGGCLGAIKGFRYLTVEQRRQLAPYLAPHLPAGARKNDYKAIF